jgi:hypothetical protein
MARLRSITSKEKRGIAWKCCLITKRSYVGSQTFSFEPLAAVALAALAVPGVR